MEKIENFCAAYVTELEEFVIMPLRVPKISSVVDEFAENDEQNVDTDFIVRRLQDIHSSRSYTQFLAVLAMVMELIASESNLYFFLSHQY
jgi:hypothetical protein